MKKFRPNKAEQLILALSAQVLVNQCKQDQSLEPGLAKAEHLFQAITNGHYWAIESNFPQYFPKSTSSVVLDDVYNILEMWNAIESSIEQLEVSDKNHPLLHKKFEFMGFDGNQDADYLNIACLLINNNTCFQRFQKRDLNSHSETLSIYYRMLDIFKCIAPNITKEKRLLNTKELISLFNATTK